MQYPENNEFFHLDPENCSFAVYNNFCFLNNFLLKSQNKIPLVLRRPLKSVIYDFAFNLILSFLKIFVILSTNRIISVNQDFKHFSQHLYVLQLSEVNQTIFSINTDFCQILSQVDSSLYPCVFRKNLRGFEVYYQKLIVWFLFYQKSILCAFFRLLRHWQLRSENYN